MNAAAAQLSTFFSGIGLIILAVLLAAVGILVFLIVRMDRANREKEARLDELTGSIAEIRDRVRGREEAELDAFRAASSERRKQVVFIDPRVEGSQEPPFSSETDSGEDRPETAAPHIEPAPSLSKDVPAEKPAAETPAAPDVHGRRESAGQRSDEQKEVPETVPAAEEQAEKPAARKDLYQRTPSGELILPSLRQIWDSDEEDVPPMPDKWTRIPPKREGARRSEPSSGEMGNTAASAGTSAAPGTPGKSTAPAAPGTPRKKPAAPAPAVMPGRGSASPARGGTPAAPAPAGSPEKTPAARAAAEAGAGPIWKEEGPAALAKDGLEEEKGLSWEDAESRLIALRKRAERDALAHGADLSGGRGTGQPAGGNGLRTAAGTGRNGRNGTPAGAPLSARPEKNGKKALWGDMNFPKDLLSDMRNSGAEARQEAPMASPFGAQTFAGRPDTDQVVLGGRAGAIDVEELARQQMQSQAMPGVEENRLPKEQAQQEIDAAIDGPADEKEKDSGPAKYDARDAGVDKHGNIYSIEELRKQIH